MAQPQHATLPSYIKLYYLSHQPGEHNQQAKSKGLWPFVTTIDQRYLQHADEEAKELVSSHPGRKEAGHWGFTGSTPHYIVLVQGQPEQCESRLKWAGWEGKDAQELPHWMSILQAHIQLKN